MTKKKAKPAKKSPAQLSPAPGAPTSPVPQNGSSGIDPLDAEIQKVSPPAPSAEFPFVAPPAPPLGAPVPCAPVVDRLDLSDIEDYVEDIVCMPFDLLSEMDPKWTLKASERKKLTQASARVGEKWLPAILDKYKEEMSLVIALVAIVGKRISKKSAPKPEPKLEDKKTEGDKNVGASNSKPNPGDPGVVQ